MPERPKFEDIESTNTQIVKVGDKWVQKEITRTETVRVSENVDLYNEAGDVIGTHRIPVMESYEEAEEE